MPGGAHAYHTPVGLTTPTYDDLYKEFHKVGGELAKLAKDDQLGTPRKFATPAEHKPAGFAKKVLEMGEVAGQKYLVSNYTTGFNKDYRLQMDNHDEAFSTASVRALFHGLMEESWKSPGGLKPHQRETLAAMFHDVSVVRAPTKYVGWAFQEGNMQHPTTKNGGMFAEKPGAHGLQDRHRANAVLQAMKKALEPAKKPTAESVIYAGLAVAAAQTTNHMMAPALASNVKPYTRMGGGHHAPIKSWEPWEKKQMASREELKKYNHEASKIKFQAKAQEARNKYVQRVGHDDPSSPPRIEIK